MSALRPLESAGRLGAVLFQFPHWFVPSRPNRDYLRELAESFPYRIAVEFRGGGWMKDERAPSGRSALLRGARLHICGGGRAAGLQDLGAPVVAATSPELAMIRFHGHNAENWEKPGLTRGGAVPLPLLGGRAARVGGRRESWPASPSSSTSS